MERYMNHPEHGRMPIYLLAEIANNEKNGWVLEPEEKPVLQLHHPDEASELSLEEQYEEKFGKKPHHRLKQETIIAKLKE